MIIAIDGPAGSGKSTTARALAQALGGYYLDTGAMYRAMALAFDRSGAPYTSEGALAIIDGIRIDLTSDHGDLRVLLGGEDVSEEIRTPDASRLASVVSRIPSVRDKLVLEQRRLAGRFSDDGFATVVEGRDIGTVVFPDAEVKFFMIADLEARAHRRLLDLVAKGESADLSEVMEDIVARDRQDEQRDHSPLRQADDAVLIDTSAMTPSQQLEAMLEVIRSRGFEIRRAQ
ncbi:MAG: (d)CMP kinase [Rhodothermales bacterium]|nr:(d)CMP kinase [Rhodothermales bacterium]